MRKIHELCDDAGVSVSYEKVSFGTKLTFQLRDPYSEPLGTEQVPSGSESFQASTEAELSENERTAVAFLRLGGAPRERQGDGAPPGRQRVGGSSRRVPAC